MSAALGITPQHLALILGLAALTAVFRLGGFFGSRALARYPIAARVMRLLPPLILAGLVARSLADASAALWAVAGLCLLAALVWRNVLATMALGVGLVLGLTLVGWV